LRSPHLFRPRSTPASSPSTAKQESPAPLSARTANLIYLGRHDHSRMDRGYQVTSAPTIVKDTLVVGSSIADNWKVDVGRGIVRGVDVPYRKNSNGLGIPSRGPTTRLPTPARAMPLSTTPPTPNVIILHPHRQRPVPIISRGLRKGDNKWANSVVAAQSIHRRICLGLSRSSITISGIPMSPRSQLSSRGKTIRPPSPSPQNGPRLRSQSHNGAPLNSHRRKIRSKNRHRRRRILADTALCYFRSSRRLNSDDAWGITPKTRNPALDKIAASRSEAFTLHPRSKAPSSFRQRRRRKTGAAPPTTPHATC